MNDNRRKLTDILKLLYDNTDQDHYMDTYQIIDALEKMGHPRPDRKTVDANIKFMIDNLGYGIEKERSKPNKYRWTKRAFELEELEMITDALLTSRFISKKQCSQIIAKLKDLSSVHQAAFLDRDFVGSRNLKHVYAHTRPNIDIISSAIKQNKQILFRFVDFSAEMNEILTDGGRIYELSPYTLAWCDSGFYVIGMLSDTGMIGHFRINRMRDIVISDEERLPAPEGFSIEDYSGRVFDLFCDRVAKVDLLCHISVTGQLLDRFGRDMEIMRLSDETFIAKLITDISPEFYAWVFMFGGRIRIQSPEWVCEEFKDLINKQTYSS